MAWEVEYNVVTALNRQVNIEKAKELEKWGVSMSRD